ncbi:type II secretion system secretin GspD [bacterium]|nr:type II secretion system secretin GspD [bacterium]
MKQRRPHLSTLFSLTFLSVTVFAQSPLPPLTQVQNSTQKSSVKQIPQAQPAAKPQNKETDSARPKVTPTKKPVAQKKDTGVFKVTDKGKVNLDFVDAEIAEIAKSISELTERNFVFDEKVRGKITLVSPSPVSIDEAYQAFISALEVKNFTVVKVGKLYKIVPIRDMKTQPLRTSSRKPYGNYDEFITRLVPIQHSNAQELVKSLRGLVSKNGDLIAYAPTNMLILTDNVANIQRMLKIINRLDQEGFQESIQFIPLEYAAAQDVAEKIEKLFDIQGSKKGPSNTPNRPSTPNNANTPSNDFSGAEGSHFISKIIPDERTNSLIVVANKEGIKRIKDVIVQLDQAMQDLAGKGRVHVHYLQYADATEMAEILSGVSSNSANNDDNRNSRLRRRNTILSSQAYRNPNINRNTNDNTSGSPVLSDEVQVTADPYTNALVITASPTDYESLIPVINKLDIRRPQAFVEAMILEVNLDKASEFGLTGHGGGDLGGGAKIFGATTFGSNSSAFPSTDPTALQGFTALLQGPTFDLPLAGGDILTLPAYGGLFKMLQSNGTINVLSTPNILTQDNTEAEIVVGRVVPFITAQGRDVNNQPINQVQREDVATTLRITPQINSSDELTLEIFQESQDLVAGANVETFGPTTSKRSTQTTVLVKDGQTVTIGGLISDKISDSESKVPVLGDIPIIGWLFKNRTKSRNKTSLVLFITPHIVRYPEDLERITMDKNDERKRFLKRNRMDDHPDLKYKKLEETIRIKNKNKENTPSAPITGPSNDFFDSQKTTALKVNS